MGVAQREEMVETELRHQFLELLLPMQEVVEAA
jgi:hypothetical protein